MGQFNYKKFFSLTKNTDLSILIEPNRFKEVFGEFFEYFVTQDCITQLLYAGIGTHLNALSECARKRKYLSLVNPNVKIALYAYHMIGEDILDDARCLFGKHLYPHVMAELSGLYDQFFSVKKHKEAEVIKDTAKLCLPILEHCLKDALVRKDIFSKYVKLEHYFKLINFKHSFQIPPMSVADYNTEYHARKKDLVEIYKDKMKDLFRAFSDSEYDHCYNQCLSLYETLLVWGDQKVSQLVHKLDDGIRMVKILEEHDKDDNLLQNVSLINSLMICNFKYTFMAFKKGFFDYAAYDLDYNDVYTRKTKQRKSNKTNLATYNITKISTNHTWVAVDPLVIELNSQLRLYNEDESLFNQSIKDNKGFIHEFLMRLKGNESIKLDLPTISQIRSTCAALSHAHTEVSLWTESELRNIAQILLNLKKVFSQYNTPTHYALYMKLGPLLSEAIQLAKERQTIQTQTHTLADYVDDYVRLGNIHPKDLDLERGFILAPYLTTSTLGRSLAKSIHSKMNENIANDKSGGLFRITFMNNAFNFFNHQLEWMEKNKDKAKGYVVQKDLLVWTLFWEDTLTQTHDRYSLDYHAFKANLYNKLKEKGNLSELNHSPAPSYSSIMQPIIIAFDGANMQQNDETRWVNRVSVSETVLHLNLYHFLDTCINNTTVSEEEATQLMWLLKKHEIIVDLDGELSTSIPIPVTMMLIFKACEAHSDVRILDIELRGLKEALSSTQKELSSRLTLKEAAHLNQQVEKLQSIVDTKNAKISNINKLRQNLETINKTLKTQIKQIKQSEAKANQERLEALESLQTLADEKNNLKQTINRQINELKKISSENTALLAHQAHTHEKYVHLKKEFEVKRAESESMQLHTQEVEAKYKQAQNQLVKMQRSNLELSLQLDAMKEGTQAIKNTASNLKMKVEELTSQLAKLQIDEPNETLSPVIRESTVSAPIESCRTKLTINLPEHIRTLLIQLECDGQYLAMLHGGFIRSTLTGITPSDADIVTNCPPDLIEAMFPTYHKSKYRDGQYSNFLEKVDIKSIHDLNLKHCAEHSDLTINALFADKQGVVFDPLHALPDFEAQRLQAIGNVQLEWKKDPIRILRLIRFHCELNWEIPPQYLFSAIEHLKGLHQRVPYGMYKSHIIRLFAKDPHKFIEFAYSYKLLGDLVILPSLEIKLEATPSLYGFWMDQCIKFQPTLPWVLGLFMTLEVLTNMSFGFDFERARDASISDFFMRWNMNPETNKQLWERFSIQLGTFYQDYQTFLNKIHTPSSYTPMYAQLESYQAPKRITYEHLPEKSNTEKPR